MIITSIITKLKENNSKFILEYDFTKIISYLIENYLFITKENTEDNYANYNSIDYINTLYTLFKNIISINPNKYIIIFFNNEHMKNLQKKHLSKLSDNTTNYDPKDMTKSYYLGLKNPSSLCYMNSVIQQLYMIPIFRESILSLKLKNISLKDSENEDDLILQLTKMFYYLTYSKKKYYDPKSFVFSFKDYEGNPTNPNIQCDAQEFLTRFIDKVEQGIKNSNQKFLCSNILGGTILQQIICSNCNNISEKIESIIYLSLDIKNNHSLYECLDKFVSEEKIEDYNCEKCSKKVTNIKKVAINDLPNIFIFYLQRIAFNYETFLMEKINDEVTFENYINIKNYTKDKHKQNLEMSNYDYELIGIICHNGTAQYGHYFSAIYTKDKNDKYKWYKFNDTTVTQISWDTLKEELKPSSNYYSSHQQSSGDYNPSPYLLLYKKKVKKPIIVNTREIESKQILDLLKDENKNDIKINDIDYKVYRDEKEAIEKNKNEKNVDMEIILKNNKLIAHFIDYDNALSYMDKLRKDLIDEEKPFISKINEENIKFFNDQKIYNSTFSCFINDIVLKIKYEIEKDNKIADKYEDIIKLLCDYFFNILSISNFKDSLKDIIKNILIILKSMPNVLAFLIKDIFDPKKEILYHDYLLTKDIKLGSASSYFFSQILIFSIENNIERNISLGIIDYYLKKIQVELSRKWLDLESFNNFILNLVEDSENIKKKFIKEEMISKLIDFILGKESPMYAGDDRNENKNLNAKLGPLIRAISILYEYYLNNKDKFVKLSETDEMMLNSMKFYENIIKHDYDEIGCSQLLNYKLINSENILDQNNETYLDLLIKTKISSSNSIDSIFSTFQLIIKLYNKIKDDKQKKQFLNIFFGIPVIEVESEVANIYYKSGKYFNCHTILEKMAPKNVELKKMSMLLVNVFNIILENKEIFEEIRKLPAPNSCQFSLLEYLIKILAEYVEFIQKNPEVKSDNINNVITVLEQTASKYNIDIENIKNNEVIDFKKDLQIHKVIISSTDLIDDIDIKALDLLQKLNNEIKVYYIKLFYYLNMPNSKTSHQFFKNKELLELHIIETDNTIHENLPEYIIEGIFIYAKKECTLKVSMEHYINTNMEIHFNKYDKKIIYIQKSEPIIDENHEKYNININNIKIEVLSKSENDKENLIDTNSQNNIQTNESAAYIICQVCNTPNTIDGNVQNYQCYKCSAFLL